MNAVYDLIESVEVNRRRVQTHAAAYGGMMRLLEMSSEEQAKHAPVFIWAARGLDDTPIEIQTDLSTIDPVTLAEVIRAVASVHYTALHAAAEQLAQNSQELMACFALPAQPVAPPVQPSQPAAQEQPNVGQVSGPAPAAAEQLAGIPPVAPGTPAPGTIQLVPPGDVRPPAPEGPAPQ